MPQLSDQGVSREYKVIWQRENRPKTYALYQTLAGAQRCVNRQLTAREEMDWLEDYRRPGEIVFGPIIRWREVGDWQAH